MAQVAIEEEDGGSGGGVQSVICASNYYTTWVTYTLDFYAF